MTRRAKLDAMAEIGRKSHFIVKQLPDGRATITVKRRGYLPVTFLCETPAVANRARLKLSLEGLMGFVEGAR